MDTLIDLLSILIPYGIASIIIDQLPLLCCCCSSSIIILILVIVIIVLSVKVRKKNK